MLHHAGGTVAKGLVDCYPAPLPPQVIELSLAEVNRLLGVDFFLTGYRVFTRFASKPSLRGLRILRSDTDRLLMALGGNLLTHYAYVHCQAAMVADGDQLHVSVSSPGGVADLDVVADLSSRPAPLPAGSGSTSCTAGHKRCPPSSALISRTSRRCRRRTTWRA